MKNKLQLLGAKLRALLSKLPKLPKLDADSPPRKVAAALALCLVSAYFVLNAPTLHSKFLRAHVGAHVYKIMFDASIPGGGTGFAIQGPSGQSYIVTNSHVCDGVLDAAKETKANLGPNELLVVDQEGFAMKRRVLEISNKTDLCLIEGLPGETGLSMGSESDIGDLVTSVGHPHLEPLTLSSGEVINKRDLQIPVYVMKGEDEELNAMTQAQDGKCDAPKNKIEEQQVMMMSNSGITIAKIKICTTVTKNAYQTNMTMYPGNSGSPVVDKLGRVIGVAFAIDGRTNYGYIVNLKDLKAFLAKY